MNKEHRIPVQIRFNDIDLMGHVYNAKYQEYFDLARIEYFKNVLGDQISWTHRGLIIASVKVDYLQSAFLDDKLQVTTNITSVGGKSLEMTQQVYKNDLREPIATCKTIMVCFDMKDRVSEVIPDNWRNKIMEAEPELAFNQAIGKN